MNSPSQIGGLEANPETEVEETVGVLFFKLAAAGNAGLLRGANPWSGNFRFDRLGANQTAGSPIGHRGLNILRGQILGNVILARQSLRGLGWGRSRRECVPNQACGFIQDIQSIDLGPSHYARITQVKVDGVGRTDWRSIWFLAVLTQAEWVNVPWIVSGNPRVGNFAEAVQEIFEPARRKCVV